MAEQKLIPNHLNLHYKSGGQGGCPEAHPHGKSHGSRLKHQVTISNDVHVTTSHRISTFLAAVAFFK